MDIVIFGISGDLALKKLLPALLTLYKNKKLPDDFRLIGYSRSLTHFELPFPYAHVQGSYTEKEGLERLARELRSEKKSLFYLALPPDASRDVLFTISEAKLNPTFILIEKPFGKGYDDAKTLIEFIRKAFRPGQCLKVDHYAGKKELREIENNIEEKKLSEISKISFEILETATVENRTGFYDEVGALRDVGQNHLLLMLATFFKGKGKREEVLSKIEIDPDVSKYKFGHYEGYGTIETFFSIPAHYNDLHCKDCSIRLSSGKALSENKSCIRIEYTNGEPKEIILSSGTSAYENIFLDAIENRDETFLTDAEVLLAWKFIEKVEDIKKHSTFFSYPKGSDAKELL